MELVSPQGEIPPCRFDLVIFGQGISPVTHLRFDILWIEIYTLVS